MIDQYTNEHSKTKMRILKEQMERERDQFLTKEAKSEQAERNALAYELESYEAVKRRLE